MNGFQSFGGDELGGSYANPEYVFNIRGYFVVYLV